MNKKAVIFGIICAIVLFSNISTLGISNVDGLSTGRFRVSRVAWGTNINAPIEAYPGDANDQLTIEVQNYSNDTIKGVNAVLFLTYPFTDTYGNLNASASGTPEDVSVINLSPGSISPGSFFTLTFSLSIDSGATPKVYSYNMTLSYMISSGTSYLQGTPEKVKITFTLSKTPTAISCIASPKQIEEGATIDIIGSITPAKENINISLMYKMENGSSFVRNVVTAADGSFSDHYRPESIGIWAVNASWHGDGKYEGSWISTSFEVRPKVSLGVTLSENRLTGGFDNILNITLTNNGNVSLVP